MTLSGIGYDAHRFAFGRPLILGGVEIPNAPGLAGHSDADVLVHAIADAILGAIGEGDIGIHFPNTDESIRGISSLKILSRVMELLAAKKATLNNVDATVVAERPKLVPYIPEMKEMLARTLLLPIERIGVKATTNEGMGFVGRHEGIAAMATASVDLP